MIISAEKIEEWIREVKARPESAPLIIQYIGSRLRDLTDRNETLLAENIALQSGKRVEEYEQRISHLEYQLDLLKRQVGTSGDGLSVEAVRDGTGRSSSRVYLEAILYDSQGRARRSRVTSEILTGGYSISIAPNVIDRQSETPRILIVNDREELLFVFSSGRIASLAVADLPSGDGDTTSTWADIPVAGEPRAGEVLAFISPITRLAVAECFLQISRRGYVKKIRSSMGQSILANHYIGAGVNQPSDQAFTMALGGREGRLALVSHEGYLLCLDLKNLPFSIEEAMRLGVSDHLVSGFVLPAGRSILVMTQIGKAIHIPAESIELGSMKTRGQPVFSAQRRSQGVRVVGAVPITPQDWVATLTQAGQITFHPADNLLETGTLDNRDELLDFTAFSPPAEGK